MTGWTRRGLMLAGAGAALSACANGVGSSGAQVIDAQVDSARDFLFQRYPETRQLADQAAGVLFMPVITQAGFGLGGAFGRGALRIDGITVDYYSAAQAPVGVQIGGQQYSHALFFMTPEALQDFRASPGVSVGADATYAVLDAGGNIAAKTLTSLSPVIAVVFGQAGLIFGATLEGTKYTRIIP